MDYDIYKNCTLCPRNCHADRTGARTGFCKAPAGMHIARAALHMWEEPCISGECGSGTIFFSNCILDIGKVNSNLIVKFFSIGYSPILKMGQTSVFSLKFISIFNLGQSPIEKI